MRLNEGEILRAVFDALDTMIDDCGLYLFMGFVYVAIPFLVWVLCGGLRRRLLKGRPMPRLPPVILFHLPGRPPEQPEVFNPFTPYHEPPHCDCDDAHWD